MRGRKRAFCALLPKVAITGPTMKQLNWSGIGTAACISSSMKI